MHRIRIASAVAAALCAAPAFSQQAGGAPAGEQGVVVTGNPLSSSTFDMVAPTGTVQGQGLMLRRSGSLGETLTEVPGVSSNYFGPSSSRPVIRGLDGDRIRILQNGTSTFDASSLSFDHAVAVDPFVAEKIEVVRGSAALFYGGSAVGGVVNVIDGRIPQRPVSGMEGEAEARTGGPDRTDNGAAKLKWGNGRLALHADAYSRRSEDVRIPNFARSARQRALDAPGRAQPTGRIPNTDGRGDGGGFGASLTFDDGHAGVSWQSMDSMYGSPAEPTVRLDMQSSRWDASGERRNLGGFIESVRAKFGRSDYSHREIDAGVIGTVFRNQGHEGRIEANHRALGNLKGAFGMQFSEGDFSAVGAEAFVPTTNTESRALFIFEELALGRLKLNVGARTESTEVKSAGGGALDASTAAPRFGAARQRSFDPSSYAVGGSYALTRAVSVVTNYSITERAPTFAELFANGPHAATGAYEVGNPTFGKEKSKGLDLGVRVRSGPHTGSVGIFRQRFQNYLTLGPSAVGTMRGADGEINPADADGDGVADGSGEDIFPELSYRGVRAELRGVEAQGRFRLLQRPGSLDLELKADTLRGTNQDTGAPLPRITPARLMAGLEYAWERWTFRVDAQRARAQSRVAPGELPTDGYTLFNAAVTRLVSIGTVNAELFVRGVNLTNEEARSHTSFFKDIAPLPGRGVYLGARATF